MATERRVADQQTAEKVGRVLECLESIDDRLGKIEYTLNGNGVPGLKTRLDRMEQTHERQAGFMRWLAGLVTVLFAAVWADIVKLFGD